MRFRHDERGQALVLTTLCMTILMGFLGLAIDVGLLFRTRQNVQIAADSAAVAAGLDLAYQKSTAQAIQDGQAAAAQNGFSVNTPGVKVTINVPPKSGPNTGNADLAEAIITAPSTTNFLGLFGFKTMNVGARAVAGMPNPGNACIWLMAPSGTALALQGSYDINVKCGIYVNSPDSNAVTVTGNGGTLNASFLDAVGDVSPQHQTTPTPITANAAARKNPFGNISGPSVPDQCSITSALTSITTANVAGVSGSLSAPVVCFTNTVTLNDGVVLPGASSGVVYVFENGVTIPPSATVTFGSGTYDASTGTFSNTAGATMEIYSGLFTQDSSSLLNIYAPTSGNYNAIAVLVPSTNTNELQIQFGSSDEVLDGYVYAPQAEVSLHDNGGGITALGVVANSMTNNTSGVTIPSYDTANTATTPNRVVSLVE
ncbi:MAG: TadE/TadG family type IV pilus assembly protein [Acidobacteriota bacterium]